MRQHESIEHEPEYDGGRDRMRWWGWLLIGVGALVLATTARELPAIRRYVNMKRM